MLSFGENACIPHYTSENEAIREKTPLGDLDLLGVKPAELCPFHQSCHESIYLEGEAPTLGISIVKL